MAQIERAVFGSSLMVRTTESRFPLILEPMAVMFFPFPTHGTSSVSPTGVKASREVRSSGRSRAAKIRVKTAVKKSGQNAPWLVVGRCQFIEKAHLTDVVNTVWPKVY